MSRSLICALVSCLACLAFVGTVSAIDPGRAEGTVTAGGGRVPLTHAYAHLHDNAEGVLSRQTELRIVVCDREIPASALQGLAFLPVEEMARNGEVVGVLLELDPEIPDEVSATLLLQPNDPGLSLMNVSLSSSGEDLWKRLSISTQSVVGEIEHTDDRQWISDELPEVSFAFHFTAPLFHEPEVTEVLVGDAARKSPQAENLRRQVAAMKAGDLDSLYALSTTEAGGRRRRQFEASGMGLEEVKSMIMEFASEAAAMNESIERVVVRGNRATVVHAPVDGGRSWATLALEDGVWKSDQ